MRQSSILKILSRKLLKWRIKSPLHKEKWPWLSHFFLPPVSPPSFHKLVNTLFFTCLVLVSLLDIKIFINIFQKYWVPILYQNLLKKKKWLTDMLLPLQRLQLRKILDDNYTMNELINFICGKDNDRHCQGY